MKTIETHFIYDEGLTKNCKPNGNLKVDKHTINIDHIVSISPWVGSFLHEGRTGTQVTSVNGKKYLDDRSYDDFLEYLLENKI